MVLDSFCFFTHLLLLNNQVNIINATLHNEAQTGCLPVLDLEIVRYTKSFMSERLQILIRRTK
jgi:hypothetical protein